MVSLPARLPRALALQILAWVAAAVLGLFLVALVMRASAAKQLSAHAEQMALRHAELFESLVPDLEPALAGQGFSTAALQQLRALRSDTEVFRFKMFDRQGHQLLASEDLDRGMPQLTPTPGRLGEHHGLSNQWVRDVVLAGRNYIELKQGDSPQRPAHYSEAYVPVLRNGHILGVVEVYVDQTRTAATIRQAQAQVSAAVAGVMLLLAGGGAWAWWRRLSAQHAVQQRVEYLAQHDVLSGALNRASFTEALQRAMAGDDRSQARFAVLCLDLDHFKDINDSLGHGTGDEVLRQVGERLRGLVRQGDHVARLGGDEFAVLQGDVTGPEAVERLARRIVDSLGQPFDCGPHRVHTGASVGAAVFRDDATELDELMHKADLAMYRAKSHGRGCFSFYDADMDEQLQQRRELVRDLQNALQHDGLSVHFQPLFDGEARTIVGYEALARWTHPERGPISPGVFVPLAEEVGLIDRLGRWVLGRACAEAMTWPEHLTVAVNLSPAQFRRDDPVAAVTEALRASGLPARRLEVEITESLLMNNTDAVLDTLRRLSQMGVRIAMDDFGTGYSSLAYLWRYPFDKLKIDRSFVNSLERDPKVSLIVKSIIGLAHSMDIRVNAEGVETPEQLRWLQQHGCDEMQGFLLGRPGLVNPSPAVAAEASSSLRASDASGLAHHTAVGL